MANEQQQDTQSGPSDRREFMATAGKLAAVLGVLGLTGEASAASKGGSSNSAKMALDYAMKTGDANKAIGKYGSKLDSRQKQALGNLSKSDLQQLKNLERKLAPLGGGERAHGIGVF